MEAGRYINVPPRVRKQIEQELNVSSALVSLSLCYRRHGTQAKQIRERALQSEEAEIFCYIPECETIHDSKGFMRQTFKNGYLLILEKETSKYWVYSSMEKEEQGEVFMQGVVSTMQDFMDIQFVVENLSKR